MNPSCLQVGDEFQVARTWYTLKAYLRCPSGDKWLIKRAGALAAFWVDRQWCGWGKARYGQCQQAAKTADCFG